MNGRRSANTSEATSALTFLVVTQYFPPERGAAQVRLGAMVHELALRGHRVEVVTAIPNYPMGRFYPGWRRRPVQVADEADAKVIRVWVWSAVGSGLSRVANYLSFSFMSVLGLARARSADWTIVEYPTLPGALPTVLWCRLRHRPVIVNVADLWVDAAVEVGAIPGGRAASVAKAVEGWMLCQADLVNAVTEGVAEAVVAKGVAPAQVRWLPNGVDVKHFAPGPADPAIRAELEVPGDHHLVVYTGTHGYVHGLDVVIDAADHLRDQPITFALVGGGSDKDRLARRATELALTNVRFHDPVALDQVVGYLRAADIGLATVRGGDLYRSVRSAKMLPVMSTATPIVYSADDEGAAIVAEVGAGRVTPPGDGAALADAITELLADPDERTTSGRRGREYVVANASWEAIIGDWLASLPELTRGH
jgi:colanic acid biosynthesis glycosyl transferase WcaI